MKLNNGLVIIDGSGNLQTAGLIESTSSGLKYPDASIRTYPTGKFIGARVFKTAVQSLSNGWNRLVLDTKVFDTGSPFVFHNTSTANLTGTVSKTASSATLTGSGTLFSSELSEGRLIFIPGNSSADDEVRVVKSIESDTSCTLNYTCEHSASGKTARYMNEGFVIPITGYYQIILNIGFAANSTGVRIAYFQNKETVTYLPLEGCTTENQANNDGASGTYVITNGIIYCLKYDQITMYGSQNSGGALNTIAGDSMQTSAQIMLIGL